MLFCAWPHVGKLSPCGSAGRRQAQVSIDQHRERRTARSLAVPPQKPRRRARLAGDLEPEYRAPSLQVASQQRSGTLSGLMGQMVGRGAESAANTHETWLSGGGGGIRTRGRLLTYTCFPGMRLKPLIHPSGGSRLF